MCVHEVSENKLNSINSAKKLGGLHYIHNKSNDTTASINIIGTGRFTTNDSTLYKGRIEVQFDRGNRSLCAYD